jgi:hypothetical protein
VILVTALLHARKMRNYDKVLAGKREGQKILGRQSRRRENYIELY